MANSTLSGYLVAAQSIAWASGTSLASLANNGWTSLSDEVDNSSNLYRFVDVYLDLGSAAFTGAGSAVEIYLIPTVDGTNYPNWTGGGTADLPSQQRWLVDAVLTTAATAAQKLACLRVELPNGRYKWGFRNRGGVALNATNTAYWRPHTLAI